MTKVLVTGNVGVDVVMGPLEPWPQPGTETVVGERTLRVGGALGNTALALHALGIQPDYAANVGDDLFGRWLHSELKAHGCTLTVTPGPTALTVALSHPNGERTFITHEGHFGAFEVGASSPKLLRSNRMTSSSCADTCSSRRCELTR